MSKIVDRIIELQAGNDHLSDAIEHKQAVIESMQNSIASARRAMADNRAEILRLFGIQEVA